MKKILLVLVAMIVLQGCSMLNMFSGVEGSNIREMLANDIVRSRDIAVKYDPEGEIAKCMTHLANLTGSENTLLNESTAGIISTAVKAYLLKNAAGHDEAAFKANCGGMAVGVLIEASKRSPGGSAFGF